jgi:hypothetical protein
MSEIIEESSKLPLSSLEDQTIVYTRRLLPSRVKLIYTGPARKVSPHTKEFIRGWVREVAHHPRLRTLFEKELLFTADGREYWLPVPNNGPDYEKALRQGETVFLFITPIGGRKLAGEFEWFFIVNKFEKV